MPDKRKQQPEYTPAHSEHGDGSDTNKKVSHDFSPLGSVFT
ncbi:hypothetical protein L248_0684 [Schleiferilactobacillus shenzhenensis LY-73]|uniref:Uncharacterized protein n=1 Tax=Schleiferilactobacillus shenzhenensis LY-73 TaxID=1231336 RepID=U4TMW3_9LACO|nr:hypothetical protein L248_0684 [Schleiferilactobacillus shenzhenensis LY-73]